MDFPSFYLCVNLSEATLKIFFVLSFRSYRSMSGYWEFPCPQKTLVADTEYFCLSGMALLRVHGHFPHLQLPREEHSTEHFFPPSFPGHGFLVSQASSTRKLLRTMLLSLISNSRP